MCKYLSKLKSWNNNIKLKKPIGKLYFLIFLYVYNFQYWNKFLNVKVIYVEWYLSSLANGVWSSSLPMEGEVQIRKPDLGGWIMARPNKYQCGFYNKISNI